MPLHVGERAPEWTLLASQNDDVVETSLSSLLEGHQALVLHTYVLDFTGG